MNNVTTATSFPSLCRHDCQHGRKCEAQEASWSRTNKQLEAWLRPRPRITGSSAEKLALIGRTSACWVQSRTESTEGGAMYRLREGFSFFLANSHNRRKNDASRRTLRHYGGRGQADARSADHVTKMVSNRHSRSMHLRAPGTCCRRTWTPATRRACAGTRRSIRRTRRNP
jgi:hypothetical protein